MAAQQNASTTLAATSSEKQPIPSVCVNLEEENNLNNDELGEEESKSLKSGVFCIKKSSISSSVPSSSSNSLCDSESVPLKRKSGLSYAEILVNFIKGMIGPGCLSLPLALKQSGLWTGLYLIFILGFLNCRYMMKLVKCSQFLSRRKGDSFLNYGNVAFEAISNSFRPLRKYAKLARIFVSASIILLQMGVCSVQYVFCGLHIKEFYEEFFAFSDFKPSVQVWMLFLLVPFLLINFVRTLRPIAVMSIIGNVITFFSLAFIFQYLLRVETRSFNLPALTNFGGVMAGCGSILYAFEAQAMILPLENKLRRPSQMVGPFGILSVGMSIVTTIYAMCGFLGFIAFGNQVRGSITLNLPQQNIAFSIVRLSLTLIVFFGYVIQLYVIVDMIWPELWKRVERGSRFLAGHKLGVELALRTALVLAIMVFAVAVPNLEKIIPLVGISAGMLLAFIVPAFLDVLTWLPIHIRNGDNLRATMLVLENALVLCLVLFGMVAGLQGKLSELFFGNTSAGNVVE